MNKSYSEMIQLKTFEDRFRYLKLDGSVGVETFGNKRYLNQILYTSRKWIDEIRPAIIIRDCGCDLAVPDLDIQSTIFVHHINPITIDDIVNHRDCLFDPENLVCCRKSTHDAIHYGDESILLKKPTERKPNDTCPWKH